MPAKRCPSCNRDYPAHSGHYRYCLLCGRRLKFVLDGDPMSEKAIDRLRSAAEFERFYMDREAERIRRGDPTPEELGTAEARLEIEIRRRERNP